MKVSYVYNVTSFLYVHNVSNSGKLLFLQNSFAKTTQTRDRWVYFAFYKPVFVPVHKNNSLP